MYGGDNVPPGCCAPASPGYGRGAVPLSLEGAPEKRAQSLGEVLYLLRNQSPSKVPLWNPAVPTHSWKYTVYYKVSGGTLCTTLGEP